MATMYERKSRLTPRQQGRLIDYFVAGTIVRPDSIVYTDTFRAYIFY